VTTSHGERVALTAFVIYAVLAGGNAGVRCRLRFALADPSTNRQLTKSAHKMIEATVAQDQPCAEEEFLTAIETPLLRIVRPRLCR
jgi:hypothetical protein